MSSNKIIAISTIYILTIAIYAYSISNFEMYKIFSPFILGVLPIGVLLWPIVLLFFKSSKNTPSQNKIVKKATIENKSRKKLEKQTQESDDIEDEGLMNKVKRLKSLYNNGTLTKDEFEKAKNKLLK